MTARRANLVVWMLARDLDPPHGLDMSPGGRDDLKVAWLEEEFATNGFGLDFPALVGYPLEGRVQLLTGTHRHLAATRTGILLPVRIVMRSVAEAAWGTDEFVKLIADIPVRELLNVEVKDCDARVDDALRVNPMRDFVWR